MDIVEVTKPMSMEKMNRYSGDAGIHGDDEAGKAAGLGGALVQGGQLVAYLEEMLLRSLGLGYIEGGRIDVAFIRPVRSSDTVTARATETQSVAEDNGQRVSLDVWLENQHGEKCVVGTASGYVP